MTNSMTKKFQLVSEYTPKGDQPEAIEMLSSSVMAGVKNQVLLGVTGSGKTFTMAHVIAKCNRPALILAPNKTLAAQLYNEFKQLFPHNAVEYFVSYYDYYQPEAYVPTADMFIEKDSSINDNIDKLRHAATHSLLTRDDIIIIASVSCIYGLGSPEYYAKLMVPVEVHQKISMDALMNRLIEVQYVRNDHDFHRGTFRVRGDVLEIIPAYENEKALHIEFFGDDIESISQVDPLTGNILATIGRTVIYPASHYVSDRENLTRTMNDVRVELAEQLTMFQKENKLVEAQRLEQRTQLDLEMMEEMGYCKGIENYSRHLDGRQAGDPPFTLFDYFPKDFLLFADESHISIPQVGGMSKGDQSRKSTLVNFGFRLPSALDNRPLRFEEFLTKLNQCIYVSATPGKWELEQSEGVIAEQIIRPTGLLDPTLEIRPSKGQIEDILSESRIRIARKERVLITTLTKRMAEDLTEYLSQMGIATKYLHSDIDTMERMEIIQALRRHEFDVLVGINLLREGLDIPEVSLICMLDADKEGFLRSAGSLIQTFGRAARNSNGHVIMYADNTTRSMATAIDETKRRRAKQEEYNKEHNITPTTILKNIDTAFSHLYSATDQKGKKKSKEVVDIQNLASMSATTLTKNIAQLEKEMRRAAKDLEFEKAAELRDTIKVLNEQLLLKG